MQPGERGQAIVPRAIASVRAWQLCQAPPKVRLLVLAVCACWLLLMVRAVPSTDLLPRDLFAFAVLIGCGAAAVEAARRQDEPAGLRKDLLSAWWLPIAFVLPPAYSLLAPVPLFLLMQYRVRRTAPYKRLMTVATIGLSHYLASWAFHALDPPALGERASAGGDVLLWTAAAIGCAAVATVVNALPLMLAQRLSTSEKSFRSLLLDWEKLRLDWEELCTGVAMAVLCALHPLLALVALTPVLLLQRGLLHDQLTAAARVDAKTGLLNAPSWESEAASEITRARRTSTPLSVMLLDIDKFKSINDEYGHLSGDDVISTVADALRGHVREYDRCARFGGDEFAVLLPQSDLREAVRTAERIRKHVAALRVPTRTADDVIRTTVSIGVAQMSQRDLDITDLLAAADVSLYRAKANGRGRVWAQDGTTGKQIVPVGESD